jgi:hypothetical protein
MNARQRYPQPAIAPGCLIDDATAWVGADYPDDRSWVHGLDDAMRAEIAAAARAAMARGIAPKDITPADFPLPLTAPLLRALYRELECGPGFAMLSRFPLEGMSEEQITLAYCGLCCHLGGITVQNRDGEYILEVTDKGKSFDSQSRGYLVLHARTAYRDAPDRRRKLLRLWLDDDNSARLGPGKMDWYLPEHSRFTQVGGLAQLAR